MEATAGVRYHVSQRLAVKGAWSEVDGMLKEQDLTALRAAENSTRGTRSSSTTPPHLHASGLGWM